MNLIETLLEVTIAEEEDFLKIKETLTRIGVASRKDKKPQHYNNLALSCTSKENTT